MTTLWRTLAATIEDGGAVMWPLVGITALLWFALGARAWTLRGSLVPRAERRLPTVARPRRGGLRPHLDDAFADLDDEIRVYRVLVRSLVTVAPLLGLLGTVAGMIETFDALADMALFTQSGGVAGGISQALLTTQVGLTIAIPGLLIGRFLDRRERHLRDDLEAFKDAIATGRRSAS